MSQPWIKIETITPDKIEVARIATALGMDRYAVLGRLIRIWAYWDQHSTNGRIDGIDAAFIDQAVSHAGFCAQLIAVGWMKIDAAGISLPHFDRHNGATAKARALAAKRAEKHRVTQRYESNAPRHARPLRGALPEERREEERREEENTPLPPEGGGEEIVLDFAPPSPEPAPTAAQFPDVIDTLAFRRSWDHWLSYRRNRRLSGRQETMTRQLAMLATLGEARAIETIEQSIRNGWAGLFPLKGGKSESTGNLFDGPAGYAAGDDAS